MIMHDVDIVYCLPEDKNIGADEDMYVKIVDSGLHFYFLFLLYFILFFYF